MWLTILSDQLPVLALVSRYLTNKLIGLEPILKREVPEGIPPFRQPRMLGATTFGITSSFPKLFRT